MPELEPDSKITEFRNEAPRDHWVVAVGASAGGLEALQRSFAGIVVPTHAAFVVLQHLSADHKSMMLELLGRHTSLPVRTAQAHEPLLNDNIYLLPAGVMMTLDHEHLAFAPKPAQGVSLPIDLFFRSLAESYGGHAVAVVLSGSGSDGAVGAAAVRAAGGYVMVQEPETAKFDSMPRSAIAAAVADAVAAPEVLAGRVLQLTHGKAGRIGQSEMVDLTAAKPSLQVIFETLERSAGLNFSEYKLPTVMRRIERRMNALDLASVSAYADKLVGSAAEAEALRREMLIPVTSFFRDPEAFESLRSHVMRPLIDGHQGDRPLRVWCAGCATGEEAYTLAILFLETCYALQKWPSIKIFATDVDGHCLEIAGAGAYPEGVASALTPERVARYFRHDDGRITVQPELRQMVLFAKHNLLEDAPFTKMDLVTCRNTLIYFQAEAQQRVMRRLQYGLVNSGVLFLGSSESLGALQPDFQSLDAKHKLYRLIRPVLTAMALQEGFGRTTTAFKASALRSPLESEGSKGLVEMAALQLAREYMPASLLVNSQRQVVHAWGPTQNLLRIQEGGVSMDVLRLMPERLAAIVGHALSVALRQGAAYRSLPTTVELQAAPVEVVVVARPLNGAEHAGYCLLTVEQLRAGAPRVGESTSASAHDHDEHVSMLERELADVRLNLESGIEELRVTNEELQSSNEELMSSNEELQSTNEELQSVNEELYTVNSEYNAKLDTVNALMADLDGMSQATGIATLFLDEELLLTRFSVEATALFRLRPSDVGRAIGDFSNALIYPDFLKDLKHTLATGERLEREVIGPHGAWYLARILAYGERPAKRRLVVSFVDVSRVHDAKRMQALIDSLPLQVAVIDSQGNIQQVNREWERVAEENGDPGGYHTGVGVNSLAVLARASDAQSRDVLRGIQQVLEGKLPQFGWTYPCHAPHEKRWFTLHVSPLGGGNEGAVMAHYNVTHWVTPEKEFDPRGQLL